MPTVHYYGKKTNFVGKTLFEILANLRNFGLNRMLIKHEELLNNPGQRCYYIVRKVEPIMDEKLQEGAIYAERVYKGAKVPELVFVDDESWHTDWRLIPRHEEHLYLLNKDKLIEHGHESTITVLPRWMEVPPLMDVFLRRHYKARKGVTVAPVKLDTTLVNIRMHYEFARINKPHNLHRIAEEGEDSPLNVNRPMKSLLKDQFKPTREQLAQILNDDQETEKELTN